MAHERSTIDICQECHEQVRGSQYFPDTERMGECDRCGQLALIARVRKDECDLTEQYPNQAFAEGVTRTLTGNLVVRPRVVLDYDHSEDPAF